MSILLLTLINSDAGLLNAASRPTEYDGPKQEPAGSWDAFWKRFEGNIGLYQFEAHDLWRSLRFYAGRWIEFIR